jgi:hypothetical protein
MGFRKHYVKNPQIIGLVDKALLLMAWSIWGMFLPVKKYFPVIFTQCGHELPFERMHARDRWRFVEFRKESLILRWHSP